jgi:membrane-bound toxin of toxin-antitoxin system
VAAFSAPIPINLGPSRSLGLGLAIAYGGAGLAILPLAWPGWIKILLEFIVIAGWIRAFRWHVQHRGDAIRALTATAEGEWIVTTARRGKCRGTLARDSVVLPWLTVLTFKLEDGRRRSVVLLPDNVDVHSFRRLRVRLRYPMEPEKRS